MIVATVLEEPVLGESVGRHLRHSDVDLHVIPFKSSFSVRDSNQSLSGMPSFRADSCAERSNMRSNESSDVSSIGSVSQSAPDWGFTAFRIARNSLSFKFVLRKR